MQNTCSYAFKMKNGGKDPNDPEQKVFMTVYYIWLDYALNQVISATRIMPPVLIGYVTMAPLIALAFPVVEGYDLGEMTVHCIPAFIDLHPGLANKCT